jgi:hypothetical protein
MFAPDPTPSASGAKPSCTKVHVATQPESSGPARSCATKAPFASTPDILSQSVDSRRRCCESVVPLETATTSDAHREIKAPHRAPINLRQPTGTRHPSQGF